MIQFMKEYNLWMAINKFEEVRNGSYNIKLKV